MSSSPPDQKNPKASFLEEATRVDLGDDLIAESSAVVPSNLPPASPRPQVSARDDLDSARILIDEGLLDDARKALFRVLRSEPGNRLALSLLEQIRATEVQAILKPEGRAQLAHARAQADSTVAPRDPEAVIAQLESDWHLGLGATDAELVLARRWVSEGLGSSSSMQERIDWSVALMQLGLAEVAVEVLEDAGGSRVSPEAMALHAQACLEARRPEEARALAEQALRDPDFPKELRNEMNYLRATAFLRTGRRAEAAAVFGSLGGYRDSRSWASRLAAPAVDSRKKR